MRLARQGARRQLMLLAALGGLGLGAVVACGNDSSAEFSDAPSRAGGTSSSGGADSPGAGAAPSEPPPEKEIESDYEAPVATGNFVWVANPKSGRVAFVNAATLQVRTVEAGNGPTHLAAVPGGTGDATLVLNVLSEDATLLRATDQGIVAKTLRTAKGVNAMAFSPDGRYAIAWADARKVPNAPRTSGFQDLTVLDLETGTSTILAVGYRPILVGFASGATPSAYAVTQDGIAIISLGAAPLVTKNVPISATPNEDPGTRDVFVTKDATTAFVRRDGSAEITTITLATGALGKITLPGPVTDLDLSDTGERAVAVVRSTSDVAIIPVAKPADFKTVTITGETIGSVSLAPGGNKALLYTNAIAAERMTILDMAAAEPSFRTVRLYSPVLGIFGSPDANHAVVVHDQAAVPDPGGTSPGAFSVVPTGSALPAKIQATLAPPNAVAVTNDRAVVSERSGSVFGAYLVRMPQLMIERYPLASPPTAVGVVASAKRAYVAQQHPEGRLTFIDLETGTARTLTGFELSSRTVDGSKP